MAVSLEHWWYILGEGLVGAGYKCTHRTASLGGVMVGVNPNHHTVLQLLGKGYMGTVKGEEGEGGREGEGKWRSHNLNGSSKNIQIFSRVTCKGNHYKQVQCLSTNTGNKLFMLCHSCLFRCHPHIAMLGRNGT